MLAFGFKLSKTVKTANSLVNELAVLFSTILLEASETVEVLAPVRVAQATNVNIFSTSMDELVIPNVNPNMRNTCAVSSSEEY